MLNTVFDVSHWKTIDMTQAVAEGLQGVLLKCTQGLTGVDPTYQAQYLKAAAAGLLLGSYHFGTDGDGKAQADHFLSVASAGLVVLDFEFNPNGTSMSVVEAADFVQRVFDTKGIWPGVYADRDHLMRLAASPVITDNCWVWIARYSDQIPVSPAGLKPWSLWQYTDGANGMDPKTVTGQPCDRSQFSGDDLPGWWGANSIS